MTNLTITDLQAMKHSGEKIACLTAYDATFAAALDAAGVDVQLVGDSLGMVIQGHDSTVPVRVEDIIYHTANVCRPVRRGLVVADMPFMSYQTPAQALGNGARLVRETGAQMVKLEGGAWLAETVRLLSERGIAVCSHLGLLPQSIHKLGGYRVQGRDPQAAKQMVADARALEAAGAVMLVLECIPRSLAATITRSVSIPVIGIGAGVECDGQVLVLHDMLGISKKQPRFSHNFLGSSGSIQFAIEGYVAAVKSSVFPARKHGSD